MAEKPRLKVIAGRPVAVVAPANDEKVDKLKLARQRYGKPFAHESGAKFDNWNEGSPKVLTDWLTKRLWQKTTSSSGKEKQ